MPDSTETIEAGDYVWEPKHGMYGYVLKVCMNTARQVPYLACDVAIAFHKQIYTQTIGVKHVKMVHKNPHNVKAKGESNA